MTATVGAAISAFQVKGGGENRPPIFIEIEISYLIVGQYSGANASSNDIRGIGFRRVTSNCAQTGSAQARWF